MLTLGSAADRVVQPGALAEKTRVDEGEAGAVRVGERKMMAVGETVDNRPQVRVEQLAIGGRRSNARNSSAGAGAGIEAGGRFRENSRETNSARSSDSSNSALYIRCSSRFCRRMSMMKAIFGCSAAM